MIRLALLVALGAAPLFEPALAAGPPDPDWPCVQRRQPALSLAQVWQGSPEDAAAQALAQSGEIEALARTIALRRTGMDEAEAMIAAFAEGKDPAALTALMVATLAQINHTRDRVMSGITRYAHKQEALDGQIEDLRHQFQTLNQAEPKDFDRIDQVEAQIDWSTRIFQDRQQSLTYVCETPVILEQRAFALGRAIAAHLPQ